MQSMHVRESKARWNTAVLAIALASVPLAKIVMMYVDYRLHWQLHQIAEPFVLFLALGVAVMAARSARRQRQGRLIRMAAIAAWSCLAYLLVSFVPGCMWAPACV